MRILQIIDSLETGGAERVAVNYANALAKKAAFSGLATTRKEGSLKNQIAADVAYLFLGRKGKFDIGAIFRLRSFCKMHQVDFVQAHGTSFFTAVLLKVFYPKISIIWHDHYGMSEFLDSRKSTALKIASLFFSGIVAVNTILKQWALKKLHCKNVVYLPNFTNYGKESAETVLNGSNGKRILCLANLRRQKDHFLLIEVAKKVKEIHPDWTFHLVGKDFEDEYSKQVRNAVQSENLQNHVFLYGSKNDTENIIKQSEIAILTSSSEGLPVALLEYGLFKKPVLLTNVGEIPLIVENGTNGFTVPAGNVPLFYDALTRLIENPDVRADFGNKLYSVIQANNSEEAVVNQFLSWTKKMN